MDQTSLFWLVVSLGAFFFGLFAGALLGGRPWVIGLISATLSIAGFLVYLAMHERPSRWLDLFILASAFLPIPFAIMYGIGYGGGLVGIKIWQGLSSKRGSGT